MSKPATYNQGWEDAEEYHRKRMGRDVLITKEEYVALKEASECHGCIDHLQEPKHIIAPVIAGDCTIDTIRGPDDELSRKE